MNKQLTFEEMLSDKEYAATGFFILINILFYGLFICVNLSLVIAIFWYWPDPQQAGLCCMAMCAFNVLWIAIAYICRRKPFIRLVE